MKLPEIVHVVSYDRKDYDLIREIAARWYEFKHLREQKRYDNEVDETFITVLQREWIIDTLLVKLRQEDDWKLNTSRATKSGKWPLMNLS